jgi:hypothetical protein
MKNEVYTDLEVAATKGKRNLPGHPIKFLEHVALFDDDGREQVTIEEAIRATLLAELNALQWAVSVKPVEVESRIKQLQNELRNA